MTVSKTALDKAIETVWTWPQAARLLHGGIYDELVERVAQFAESISQEATAELQKENARLAAENEARAKTNRELHQEIKQLRIVLDNLSRQAGTAADREMAQKGLSKEKAK